MAQSHDKGDFRLMSTLIFTGDCGPLEHWPPYNGVPYKSMPTAIVRICTNEGMVIAADGRELRGYSEVTSEETQKIFPIPNAPVAYAVFGSTGMSIGGDNPNRINFIEEAQKAQSLVSLDKCHDLFQYVERFSQPIQERLSLWRIGSTTLFPPGAEEPGQPGNTILHLFFFGYHRGVVETIDLRFYHRYHILSKPLITPIDVEIGYPVWVRGSKIVAAILFDSDDEKLSKYRVPFPKNPAELTADIAAKIASGYIEACCSDFGRELDPISTKGIGGHIHIAKITPKAFEWIVPPLKAIPLPTQKP